MDGRSSDPRTRPSSAPVYPFRLLVQDLAEFVKMETFSSDGRCLPRGWNFVTDVP